MDTNTSSEDVKKEKKSFDTTQDKKDAVETAAQEPAKEPFDETQGKPVQEPVAEDSKEPTEKAEEPAQESESTPQPVLAVSGEPLSTTTHPDAKWYVIHVKTGYEARVKKALQQRIVSLGVEDRIFDIIIPMREIVVVKKGKKSKVQEKVFPGYVLTKMILDDDSWLVVRTTEGVTGFVGAGLKPTPISEKEVQAIIQFVQQEQPKFKAKFSVGEAVKIIEGPFSDFLGTIEAIDDERGRVRVLISIFDRETPVELDFLQVAKL